jgi:hypothetical protein
LAKLLRGPVDSGGAEKMRHTECEGRMADGKSSLRWSNGDGGTAKSGGGGAALAARAGKTEMWEGEGHEGAVLGRQTATGKENGEEVHGGLLLFQCEVAFEQKVGKRRGGGPTKAWQHLGASLTAGGVRSATGPSRGGIGMAAQTGSVRGGGGLVRERGVWAGPRRRQEKMGLAQNNSAISQLI